MKVPPVARLFYLKGGEKRDQKREKTIVGVGNFYSTEKEVGE